MTDADPFEALLFEIAHAPNVDPDPLTTLGPFHIVERLGAGGMGEVFLAEDTRLERSVALKVLPLAAENRRAQMLVEAKAAARISHPHVATVFEVGEDRGRLFIAMELIDGVTLAEAEVTHPEEVALQLTEGLAAAHRAGVLHLDLKPENVMISISGRLKILDFGLARLTHTTALPYGGTPGSMAPEQEVGDPVDARTDVFAVGLLLHQLVGHHRRAKRVVARCLQYDPEDRFDSAVELHAALIAALGVRARNDWFRASVGVAAVIALLVGSLLMSSRPRPEPVDVRLTANPAENLLLDSAVEPDGVSIAYTDQLGLHVLERTSREIRGVELPPGYTSAGAVAYADDGIIDVGLSGEAPPAIFKYRPADGSFEKLLDGGASTISEQNGVVAVIVDHRDLVIIRTDEAPRRMWMAAPFAHVIDVELTPDGRYAILLQLESGSEGLVGLIISIDLARGTENTLLRSPLLRLENGAAGLYVDRHQGLYYVETTPQGQAPETSLWRAKLDAECTALSDRQRLKVWRGSTISGLDGDRFGNLLIEREDSQTDIYVGRLPSGTERFSPRRLTLSDHQERPSEFVDARRLLFISDRHGRYGLFEQSIDGGDARAVLPADSTRTWPSKFGERLLFWDIGDPYSRLLLQRREGGAPTEVTRLITRGSSGGRPGPTSQMHRCRDQRCILSRIEGSAIVFSELDRVSLKIEPVFKWPRAGLYTSGWGFDGRRIVIAERKGRFLRYDLDTGEETSTAGPKDCELQSVVPIQDRDDLVFTAICDSERPYRLMRIRDGVTETLHATTHAWIAHPTISPDNRTIAFAVKPIDVDLWWLSGGARNSRVE